MDIHPNIKLLQSAIAKHEVTQQKITAFEKWINNPAKFKEEYRELAEKTLLEAKSLLASGSGSSGYQELENRARSMACGRPEKRPAGRAPDKTSHVDAADAESIGSPFHNPYTFIPFPKNPPKRYKPTPLTIDEAEPDRLTGVLSVKLKTLSPLLSVEPQEKSVDDSSKIKTAKALRIGQNPIVPASSIRGVIRNLTAIISGSALDYVDDELWLCQGRDANLDDPRHTMKLYLAEIIKPGDSFHDGIVRAGSAELVKTQSLRIEDRERKDYAQGKRALWISDPNDAVISTGNQHDPAHPWRVKISGRKVNSKGCQHEGCFRLDQAREITLRKELWKDYRGRYRNAEKKELRKGDLVWLELDKSEKGLDDGHNVKSIQWARWGRTGVNFKEQLKRLLPHMLPDSIKNDGLVDITSDLFGSIPMPEENMKPGYDSFAARIRPENLVFESSARTFMNQMPPLSGPHPGCKAFYVTNDNYDLISLDDLPRGYKVYRTSRHDPGKEPWKYDIQPIFYKGKATPFNQAANMTRTCELISQDSSGSLKIAFRSLSKQEFSLLLLVLSCDLRIGGGKPLGLGHCVVSEINAYDETGEKFLSYQPERACLPEGYSDLPTDCITRAGLYCKTQLPVEMMRYPRAVNNNQQGGMCWFGYFAAPKKNTRQGLATVWTDQGSPLQARAQGKKQIKAQALPMFDPNNPESDLLFGYDLNGVGKRLGQVNYYQNFNSERPDPDRKYDNFSPNRNSRQAERDKRR